ncbi:hypothetical protein AN1V17_37960 [Vallitalea sediminicola]
MPHYSTYTYTILLLSYSAYITKHLSSILAKILAMVEFTIRSYKQKNYKIFYYKEVARWKKNIVWELIMGHNHVEHCWLR